MFFLSVFCQFVALLRLLEDFLFWFSFVFLSFFNRFFVDRVLSEITRYAVFIIKILFDFLYRKNNLCNKKKSKEFSRKR